MPYYAIYAILHTIQCTVPWPYRDSHTVWSAEFPHGSFREKITKNLSESLYIYIPKSLDSTLGPTLI